MFQGHTSFPHSISPSSKVHASFRGSAFLPSRAASTPRVQGGSVDPESLAGYHETINSFSPGSWPDAANLMPNPSSDFETLSATPRNMTAHGRSIDPTHRTFHIFSHIN